MDEQFQLQMKPWVHSTLVETYDTAQKDRATSVVCVVGCADGTANLHLTKTKCGPNDAELLLLMAGMSQLCETRKLQNPMNVWRRAAPVVAAAFLLGMVFAQWVIGRFNAESKVRPRARIETLSASR